MRRVFQEAKIWIIGIIAAALIVEFLSLTGKYNACEKNIMFYLARTAADCEMR